MARSLLFYSSHSVLRRRGEALSERWSISLCRFFFALRAKKNLQKKQSIIDYKGFWVPGRFDLPVTNERTHAHRVVHYRHACVDCSSTPGCAGAPAGRAACAPVL